MREFNAVMKIHILQQFTQLIVLLFPRAAATKSNRSIYLYLSVFFLLVY